MCGRTYSQREVDDVKVFGVSCQSFSDGRHCFLGSVDVSHCNLLSQQNNDTVVHLPIVRFVDSVTDLEM